MFPNFPTLDSSKLDPFLLEEVLDTYYAIEKSSILAVIDGSGKILRANQNFCRITKYFQKELTEIKYNFFNAEVNSESFIQNTLDSLTKGKTWYGEIKNIAKDGSEFWLQSTLSPFLDDNQKIKKIIASCHDITESKLTESLLIDSEKQFRGTFEQMAVGIAHVGLDGTWLRVNQRLCDILGYSKEEFHKMTFQDITHPEDIETDLNLVEQIIKGEITTYSMEKRYFHKDNSILWAKLTVALFRNLNNEPDYFISVIEDITDRKKLEKDLKDLNSDLEQRVIERTREVRESEERMRLVGNLGTDGFWDWNLTTNEEYLSPSFKALFGYEDHELPNHVDSWQRLIFPEDLKRAEEAFVAHTEHGEPYKLPVRYKHKDGSTVWVLCRGVALKNENGEYTRMVGTHIDITKEKEAEEKLRQFNQELEQKVIERNEELAASEKHFREITVGLPLLVWTCRGDDGKCDYLSPQWVEYTGIPEKEQLGFEWLKQLHPEDQDRTISTWNNAVEKDLIFEIDFRIRRYDGEYRWFKTRALPLRDKDGKIIRWFGVNTDIHDKIVYEEKLQAFTKELQRSNHELEQFAYIASHDLQEPLRMVASYTELLARKYEGKLDEKADLYIKYSTEGARRMQQLVNDILTYSRIGVQNKTLEPIESKLALEKALKQLDSLIKETDTKIIYGDMPVVAGDELQLSLVFQNLISNSIKFRKEDISPKIKIDVTRSKKKWLFSVEDNGIGIDEKHSDLIFKMFQRLHHRDSYEGSGIGLSITKKIVETHGGRIWLDKETKEGTKFYFTIPFVKEEIII